VDHADFLGGAETGLVALVRHLDRERFLPVLAGEPAGPLAEAFRAAGGEVEDLGQPALRGLRNPGRLAWQVLTVSGRLAALARRRKAALIHANVMRSSFYSAPAAWRCGLPHVWHIKDLHLPGWYSGLMAGLSRGIIAMSPACLEQVPGWARSRAEVIADGLDLEAYDPGAVQERAGAVRARLGVRDDELLIGNAAWFARWKGQHLFVEACRLLTAQRQDCRFVAFGAPQGEENERYFAEVRQQGEGLVEFPGLETDMPAALAALDVFVNASRDEPFGRVLIEALAMGVPVISHDSGGPRTILTAECGRLVSDYSAQALAEGVLAVLPRREAMGRAARRRAQEEFSGDAMARRVEDHYARIVPRLGRR